MPLPLGQNLDGNGTQIAVAMQSFQAKAIVLPENWTGGLDGELEGTIIPS
jgi:hypothetical protein